MNEVGRITQTADFNSVKLFDGGSSTLTFDPDSSGLTVDQERILESLKTSWLEQSEKVVTEYPGITADGYNLEIIMDEDTGDASAFVSYAIYNTPSF
jgi:flagellin